jgi:hypothetical protein
MTKKQRVPHAVLHEVTQEAKDRNQRMGQYVVNTLLPSSDGESTSPLFYCEDSRFWDTVFDYIEVY